MEKTAPYAGIILIVFGIGMNFFGGRFFPITYRFLIAANFVVLAFFIISYAVAEPGFLAFILVVIGSILLGIVLAQVLFTYAPDLSWYLFTFVVGFVYGLILAKFIVLKTPYFCFICAGVCGGL